MKRFSATLIVLVAVAALPACDEPVQDGLRFLRRVSAQAEILDMQRHLSGVQDVRGIGDAVMKKGPGLGVKSIGENPSKPPPRRPKANARLDSAGLPTEIRRILARHRGAFNRCYEHRLNMDPTLAGEVVLALDIPAEGVGATASVVSDTLKDEAATTCLVKQANRLRFPARDEPLHIEFELQFKLVH